MPENEEITCLEVSLGILARVPGFALFRWIVGELVIFILKSSRTWSRQRVIHTDAISNLRSTDLHSSNKCLVLTESVLQSPVLDSEFKWIRARSPLRIFFVRSCGSSTDLRNAWDLPKNLSPNNGSPVIFGPVWLSSELCCWYRRTRAMP
jgi:hypothetical protein